MRLRSTDPGFLGAKAEKGFFDFLLTTLHIFRTHRILFAKNTNNLDEKCIFRDLDALLASVHIVDSHEHHLCSLGTTVLPGKDVHEEPK